MLERVVITPEAQAALGITPDDLPVIARMTLGQFAEFVADRGLEISVTFGPVREDKGHLTAVTKRERAELELQGASDGLTAAWNHFNDLNKRLLAAMSAVDRARERLDNAEDAVRKFRRGKRR